MKTNLLINIILKKIQELNLLLITKKNIKIKGKMKILIKRTIINVYKKFNIDYKYNINFYLFNLFY